MQVAVENRLTGYGAVRQKEVHALAAWDSAPKSGGHAPAGRQHVPAEVRG